VKDIEGDFDGAMDDFDRAVKIDPEQASGCFVMRAAAEYRKNNFDRAIDDATQAIEQGSAGPWVYLIRAWARFQKGDKAGALVDAQKASGINDPTPALTNAIQGFLAFLNGRYDSAIKRWEQASREDAAFEQDLRVWIQKAKANLDKKAQHTSP
jgi:tetratricopeptide (TPR) repeat protein